MDLGLLWLDYGLLWLALRILVFGGHKELPLSMPSYPLGWPSVSSVSHTLQVGPLNPQSGPDGWNFPFYWTLFLIRVAALQLGYFTNIKRAGQGNRWSHYAFGRPTYCARRDNSLPKEN